MLPYVLLFAFVSLGLASSRWLAVRAFYYLSATGLALFAGLRAGVGTDYESYATTFKAIKGGYSDPAFAPMNMVIIETIQFFGGGKELIFLAYAVITMAGIVEYARRVSVSKEFSLFVYMTVSIFYLSSFNIVRQWAAASMMLFSITSLLDRRYWRMTCFIVLACLFHLSALVLVVVPWLTTRVGKRWVLLALALSGALAEVIQLVIERLPFVHYLNPAFHQDRMGSLPLFALYVSFLVFALLRFRYFSKEEPLARDQVVALNMCLLSVFTLLMGYIIGLDFQATMRANMYFSVQLIVLIPWLLRSFDPATRVLASAAVIAALSAVFFGTLYFKGADYVLTPYASALGAG